MKVKPLDIDFHKKIKTKKKFLTKLVSDTDIELKLIRRAIHHMTMPPYECHEIFSKIPKIEELKKSDPAEYNKIISARKALSALINSSVISAKEKKSIKLMEERIIQDYEIDLTDRKALMDNFRSQTDVNSIEDYKNYSDETYGWEIDKNLNTDQQCEGKLITMLYNYLRPLADTIFCEETIGDQKEYTQKNVFELIAEILNLRRLNEYDYKKIRTIYRNFQSVKL